MRRVTVTSDRRAFLARSGRLLLLTGAAQLALESVLRGEPESAPNYDTTAHWWAMAAGSSANTVSSSTRP